tara:strand:+ start:128 stop:415 length:288 start_codon:yes stop_codon:yes gene_type:complete
MNRAQTLYATRRAPSISVGNLLLPPLGQKRKVILQGSTAIITGADEDGKPWKVKGVYSGKGMLIDFTAKGGPKDVLATWNGIGLVFPDGNVWMKS